LGFERKLQDMAVRDTLTQVLNRRAILDEVHRAWKEAQFARGTLAVVMVDVMGLAAINAQWGTPTGDYVLTRVAQLLRDRAAGVGHVGRWGGDEFLVLMPDMTQHQGQEWVSAVQWAVSAEPWQAQEGPSLQVHVDCGLAVVGPTTLSVKDLLQKAEETLRRKTQG
jgi:diguanylate cyclase (GGDEF)-like protein